VLVRDRRFLLYLASLFIGTIVYASSWSAAAEDHRRRRRHRAVQLRAGRLVHRADHVRAVDHLLHREVVGAAGRVPRPRRVRAGLRRLGPVRRQHVIVVLGACCSPPADDVRPTMFARRQGVVPIPAALPRRDERGHRLSSAIAPVLGVFA